MSTDIQLPDASPALLSDEAVYGLFIRSQRSQGTQRAFDQSIRDFGRFLSPGDPLEGSGVVNVLRQLDGAQANLMGDTYRTALTEAGKSRSTIAGRVSALQCLCKSMRRHGVINYKPEIAVAKVTNYRDTRGPGHEGFIKIFRAIGKPDRAKQARDRSIVLGLYCLCLRRFQVGSLDLSDLDLEGHRLHILDKGGGEQKSPVTLPRELENELRHWISFRGDKPGPLFVGLHPAGVGGRLTGNSIRKLVMGYGKQVGIKVWPHALKHAGITTALDRSGGDVRKVQQLSRHAKLETLMKYDDNRRDDAGVLAGRLCEGLEEEP